MSQLKYPVEQSEPPRSPRETLPTMYDLPNENPEEPGLRRTEQAEALLEQERQEKERLPERLGQLEDERFFRS